MKKCSGAVPLHLTRNLKYLHLPSSLMQEVINIGVSHRANHLLTQFYNCQEQSLEHTSENSNHSSVNGNDPAVFLNPIVDKVSKTVSYTPRAILWDAKTGNGALATHQYSNSGDYYYGENCEGPANPETPAEHVTRPVEIIKTHERVLPSEYQAALDSGTALPQLDVQNTQYWSDYAKLIYSPSSLNNLQNWYHDPTQPSMPDFQNLHQTKFDSFEIGYQEFRDNYATDFFDGCFRRQVEQCDNVEGFNLVTEVDNGWGGFSSALLLELRDEMPKKDVYTWASNQDDVLSLREPVLSTKSKFKSLCNKIRSTLPLCYDSTLFFPLYADPQKTLWESASRTCMLFDTINSVVSQTDLQQRRSLDHIASALTRGEPTRNIVSTMRIRNDDFSFYSRIPPYKTSRSHVFSQCNISRDSEIKEKDIYLFNTYAWQPSDTISEEYRKITNYNVHLAVDERPRNVFKHWFDMVSRYFRYDSDREELKEQLGTLASIYEEGWYDDDDSGDDM